MPRCHGHRLPLHHTPRLPDWPGRETFTGELVEHGAGRVRLAVRTPPHVVLRSIGGVPTTLISVLTRHVPSALADPVRRLPGADHGRRFERVRPDEATEGLYRRVREERQIPITYMGLVAVVKAGQVEIVPAVTALARPEGVSTRRWQPARP